MHLVLGWQAEMCATTLRQKEQDGGAPTLSEGPPNLLTISVKLRIAV
jgi:hypothetical protein